MTAPLMGHAMMKAEIIGPTSMWDFRNANAVSIELKATIGLNHKNMGL